MKKIILIIAIAFCIFQMIVLAVDIDIGSPAINRDAYVDSGYTYILKENPANEDGKITDVELYTRQPLTGCTVATFFLVEGSILSARDSHYIGDVPGWGKQSFSDLNIEVKTGDYIGLYFSGGGMESDETGYDLLWYKSGDYTSSSDITYSAYGGDTISLYGTGTTPQPPDQVTNVQATDGTYTDKVRVTWDIASGADKYYVWNGSSWIDVGDILTWDHTEAPAPTITAGTASASNGASADYVTLSIAGESANNGSSISYKVKAWNAAAGYGAESDPDTGYRGVGTLTYQWQKSAGDSDANYSNIDGAITDPYNDTGAPADGSGRYYKCIENATGVAQQTTNSDRGYRLLIGPGWNVNTAIYDEKFKDVSAQDIHPSGVFFKYDGTKMYIAGYYNIKVYQYSLSAVWDVGTASYENKYKSVLAQDDALQDVFFKPDGTKMYIAGSSSDTIYQYSLSTAWDISTAEYEDKYKSVGAQDGLPFGIFFKPDGSKMYMMGAGADIVYQYSLSTSWDISTADYDNKYKDVSDKDYETGDVFFKPDGTKMYIVGAISDTIYQYSLSTAWDISTANYDNRNKDISGEDGEPQDIFFRPEGAKMYMVGYANDRVHQYSLEEKIANTLFFGTPL